jgi:hypothetical protein
VVGEAGRDGGREESGTVTVAGCGKEIYSGMTEEEIEEFAKLIIRGSGIMFSGDEVPGLNRPCVYMFVREGKALYVGKSSRGLSRVFTGRHDQARESRLLCTELYVWFCETAKLAAEAENFLIYTLEPRFNKRLKMPLKLIRDRLGVKNAQQYFRRMQRVCE